MSYLTNFFGGLKIATKLRIGLGTILLIAMGIGAQSVYSARSQSERIRQMYELEVKGISFTKEAQVHLMEVGRSLRQMVLSPDRVSQQIAYVKLTESRAILRYSMQEADALLKDEVGRKLLSDTQDMIHQYFSQVDQILVTVMNGNQRLVYRTDEVSRQLASPENVHVFTAVDQLMIQLVKHQESKAQQHSEEAAQFTSQLERTIGIWLIAGVMLGGLVGTVVALSVRRPAERLRQSVVGLAAGQLNITVPHTDYANEIGDMARALLTLQASAQDADIHRWVKSCSASLSAKFQAFGEIEEFHQALLPLLMPLVGAEIGLLFLRNEIGGTFRFKSGVGIFNPGDLKHEYQPGEGMVGRCALEGVLLQVNDLPDGSARIHSGVIHSTWAQVKFYPVHNTDGEVIAVLEMASIHPSNERQVALMQELLPVIGLNLTILERQRMSSELLMETQILASALQEQRTALVAQAEILKTQRDELELARQRAEEATRVKGEFLANMSHEIRTPMNAVIGLSYLALKTNLSAQQQDYLQKIHSEGTALLDVINDILDFSKMEAGKVRMENAEFRLDHVLDGAASLLAPRAAEKGLDFPVHVGPAVPAYLVGDPQRLRQVLINLIGNGIKFTEKGSVSVEVDVIEQADERIRLSFAVQDTGIGITEEDRSKLFSAFSQVDTTNTRRFGGTGLGLVISKRIADMMDGDIQVTSDYGKGSTFLFSAWFGISPRQLEHPALASGSAPLKVLVVDDNAAERMMLSEQLSSMGIAVSVASSAHEALIAIRSADASMPYQVVLMDWRMPEMDGVQAAGVISRDQTLQHKPAVVLITAFGLTDIHDAAVEAGVLAFLEKPVSQSRLWDTLARFQRAGPGSEVNREDSSLTQRQALGIKVLLVEDNEINQQVATELMASMGVEVTIARHGQEALDYLESSSDPIPWSVVLMDMQMPVMDGHQATVALRQQARFQQLPILAMTAHALTEEVERCLAEGVNQHLTKPIDPQALYDALVRWGKPRVSSEPIGAVSSSPDNKLTISRETTLPPTCLDEPRGISQCGGSREVYRSILLKFIHVMENAPDQIKAAMASGNIEEARRLAHTLKGVSGNIGASQCNELSKALESELRAWGKTAKAEQILTQLDAHYPVLMAAIAKACTFDEPHRLIAASENHVHHDAFASISALIDMLTFNDADTEAYFAQREELFRDVLGVDFEPLKSEIEGFDFGLALTRLKRHAP